MGLGQVICNCLHLLQVMQKILTIFAEVFSRKALVFLPFLSHHLNLCIWFHLLGFSLNNLGIATESQPKHTNLIEIRYFLSCHPVFALLLFPLRPTLNISL